MQKSSVTKTINLSLVSYTHNDNALLSASLEQIASWSLKPKEIILVDDASATPFVPPTIAGLPPVTLLRTPKNLGYCGAKALGLNHAKGRFILSLDADIRLCPNWLEICLQRINNSETGPQAHSIKGPSIGPNIGPNIGPAIDPAIGPSIGPSIGMISGPIIPKCGNHLFARYMELTYSLNLGIKGPVKFIPGASWLMPRKVWEDVGGYEGYAHSAGEDDFLCKNLLKKGYTLWVEDEALAYEVRPMRRLDMVRRAWKWHGIAIKRAILEGRSIVEAINVLLYSVKLRTEKSAKADPRFLYYDLLYLTYGLNDLLLGIPQAANLWASFQTWLTPYPMLASGLVKDLMDLGYPDAEKNLMPNHKIKINNAKNYAGLDIAKALAFAFDETILNTLNNSMNEITVDIS